MLSTAYVQNCRGPGWSNSDFTWRAKRRRWRSTQGGKNNVLKNIALLFLCLFSSLAARAQFGECDPLNVGWVETSADGWGETLDTICSSGPPKALPINNCDEIGNAFITYSDATILSDGTIQAFAVSEDLSKYRATSDV